MEYLFCFCFLVSFLVLFFLSIKKLTEHHTVASAHRSRNDEVRLCFLIFMIDIILSAMCIAIDQVYIEIYIDIKILPSPSLATVNVYRKDICCRCTDSVNGIWFLSMRLQGIHSAKQES